MLEKEGYPFKSKEHSQNWREYVAYGFEQKRILRYLELYKRPTDTDSIIKRFSCPKTLRYQFTDEYKKNGLKISDMCCVLMKEEPLNNWQMQNKKPYGLVGIMKEEGGRRINAHCLTFKKQGRMNFQPLIVVTKEWEEWFIDKYDVEISDIYKPPYNFERTGCKGCPFALHLQDELDTIQRFFPNERKQCEAIWKPVYEEYRRLGYRLRKNDNQMTLYDLELDKGGD